MTGAELAARASARLQRCLAVLNSVDGIERRGRLVRVTGGLLTSAGPTVGQGQWCRVGDDALAEVVGFRDGLTLLAPLENGQRYAPGQVVEALGRDGWVWCGPGMLGRVLNEFGAPVDGEPMWSASVVRHLGHAAPMPLQRPAIVEPLPTGVRAIDALCTLGRGQRVGLFAGSGVGKSTLLGMAARGTDADVVVCCLIGERGREVGEYLEILRSALDRTVVVATTSDRPPICRARCADTAMTIAEYFREQGKNVLLLMDSLTRYCQALREIGLAAGESPAARGYPPSVFSSLPQLLERAGRTESGSITLIATVLVDGDDMDEPVADAARGLLDGHIILSRRMAERGQYPPVDVPASVSRLMPAVTNRDVQQAARAGRAALSRAEETADLIAMGAYRRGADPDLDAALDISGRLRAWLCQAPEEFSSWGDTMSELFTAVSG